eukprot:symbB.v1.2.013619.t1/scaffold968.1/size148170/14
MTPLPGEQSSGRHDVPQQDLREIVAKAASRIEKARLGDLQLDMVSAIEELKDQGHGDQSHCRDAGWRDILHPGPDTIATMAMEGVTGPEARPRWVVAGLGRHLECLDQVQGLTSGAGVGPGILPCQKKAWKRSLCCLLDALDRLLRKAALRVALALQAMDLEARDEHEARPLLGNLGQNKLATAAEKQQACTEFWLAPVDPSSCFTVHLHGGSLHGESVLAPSLHRGHSSSVLIGLGQLLGVWRQRLARLMLASILCGLLVGLAIYYTSMVFYFHYQGAATYTNVVPSQPAESILDAGVVSFAVGSTVDRSRSVGFQSSSGNLICVAPVVDVSMRPGTPANLFAYGINCCKHRGSFNCDDAGNPAARYGMVLPEPSDILPPLLQDAFPGPSAEDLESAVRLQQASFGRAVRTQSRHTFVQYVTDPLKVEMAHVDTAVLQGLGCSVLYFALLTLAVSCIVLGNGTVGSFFRRLVL